MLSGGNLGEAEGWYLDEKYWDYLSDSQGELIRESLEKRDREEKEKERQRIIFESSKLQAEISTITNKIDNYRANSEFFFDVKQYGNALIEALKGNEILENTSLKQSIPTYVKQKIEIVLHSLIHSSTIENNTFPIYEQEINSYQEMLASILNISQNISQESANIIKRIKGNESIITYIKRKLRRKLDEILDEAMYKVTLNRKERNEKEINFYQKIIKAKLNISRKVANFIKNIKNIKINKQNKSKAYLYERIIYNMQSQINSQTIAFNYPEKLFQNLYGHTDKINSVKFSPDNKIIASASWDKTVKLWSVVDGELLDTLSGHEAIVHSVKFSPDGKFIASTSYDNISKLWSTTDRKLLHTLSICSVEFSPDNQTIAFAAYDGTIKLWSLKDKNLLHTLSGHKNKVKRIKFSPDGKIIASASQYEKLKLWSAEDGKLLHTLSRQEDYIYPITFSPNSKILASTSEGRTLKLWLIESGEILHVLSGHKDKVESIKFSPDGKMVVSASWDKTLKLWSTEGGQLLHTLYGHQDCISSVKFSLDGKIIASASWDETVKLWNWNFDNLLKRGYDKLESYLVNHPEKLEELKSCEDSQILNVCASVLIIQGEKLAKHGDSKGALSKFGEAKKINMLFDTNSES